MPLIRKPRDSSQEAEPKPAFSPEELASPDENRRWAAARAAAGNPDSAIPLATALRAETSPRVREALFTSLARMNSPAAAVHILPFLRSDDANLRTGALDVLRTMSLDSQSLLPSLLADADVDVRVLSCELVRALPDETATSLLCELLRREPEPNVCAAALDVLAEVGNAEALPILAACALKFHDTPFLAFAIRVTADRIRAHSSHSRD